MKSALLFCAASMLTPPAIAAPVPAPIAESKQAHSSVSILVEPQLNDGRLVIKIAAKNGSGAAVPFGPAAISISKVNGDPIPLSTLQQLVNDIRLAAGMPTGAAPGGTPTTGAYASRVQPVATDGSGRMDVTGYTNGSAMAPDEMRQWSKKTLDPAAANTQIAALKQSILQDTTIQPGQIAVGQVVSQKLKFNKSEDRTVHLRIHIGGDEHGFTIAAPSN